MSRPLLDVTEVLTDPMFQDTELSVTRIVEVVGQDGVAEYTPTTSPFAGVVVQERGSEIQRREDGTRHAAQINIYTRTDLIDGEDGRTADIVTWRGRTYTVARVLDWSTYGRGFRHAICDILSLTPPAGSG